MFDIDEYLALCDGNAKLAADWMDLHSLSKYPTLTPLLMESALSGVPGDVLAYLDTHSYTDSTIDELLEMAFEAGKS